jgi:hypothetical protein
MATKRKPKRKTATKKTERTLKAPTDMPEPPLPSPEWLAEMALRLWDEAKSRPTIVNKRGINYAWVAAARKALDAYRAAAHALHSAKLNRQRWAEISAIEEEIKKSLSHEEAERGRVEYLRACKIITGEERKDRAKHGFTKLTEWLYTEAYWINENTSVNEPPPAYQDSGFMHLREVAALRREFLNMKKIPKKILVQAISQFGPLWLPTGEKTGQKRGKA